LGVTTTGTTPTAVSTYPLNALVTWSVAGCPNLATSHIEGTRVLDTAHVDNVNGYRWDSYQWGWSTRAGYQRTTVIVASAPSGQPAPLPRTSPNARSNLVGTMGQLLANRHLRCAPVRPTPDTLANRLVRQVMASGQGVHP
jgi:hypothetical protein